MLTRRSFIHGALSAAAVPASMSTAQAAFRRIPSTGANIPAIGLGSWITFNVGNDPVLLDNCAAVMAAFFEEGGGMIDSSPMYGSSQTTIGYGLSKLAYPGTAFSAEKVWTNSPDQGRQQIEASRSFWGVNGFNLLQVHNLVAWQQHLEMLFAMKDEGRLEYVGITTSHGRRHRLLEQIMRDYPIDFVQLTYNLADRVAESRLLPLAQEKGIGVIANRPLRRGALPRALKGKPLPDISSELGVNTWAEVLLKFIISHPAVTVAIPATSRVMHVRENKAAGHGLMPDAAMRKRIISHFAAL